MDDAPAAFVVVDECGEVAEKVGGVIDELSSGGEKAGVATDASEIGVNIEDVHIDHDPGRPVGVVELAVAEDRVDLLQESLEARGWTTHR